MITSSSVFWNLTLCKFSHFFRLGLEFGVTFFYRSRKGREPNVTTLAYILSINARLNASFRQNRNLVMNGHSWFPSALTSCLLHPVSFTLYIYFVIVVHLSNFASDTYFIILSSFVLSTCFRISGAYLFSFIYSKPVNIRFSAKVIMKISKLLKPYMNKFKWPYFTTLYPNFIRFIIRRVVKIWEKNSGNENTCFLEWN